LQDVYWSGEGQLSVEAVSLPAACLGLAGILIADGVLAFICVLKGKYRTALFALWAPLQTAREDFVGGKPSRPNPPASDDVHR
jgi:hypothetical protein